MVKIIVGSQNAAKVAAVQLAVTGYWQDAEVAGKDVPSGVRPQPLGEAETLQGAINRARAAFLLHQNRDLAEGLCLGIGLEGGVIELHGGCVMMSYVAVTDGKFESVVPVTGTPLPASWGAALAAGAELRPYVIASGLDYDYKQGVIGTLTAGKLRRDAMFTVGVQNALVPWVNPGLYVGETGAMVPLSIAVAA